MPPTPVLVTHRGGFVRRAGRFVQLTHACPDGVALNDDGNVVVAYPDFGSRVGVQPDRLPLH